MIDATNDDDLLDPLVLEALANALPSVPPPQPSLRASLFARIGGQDRFLPFLDRLMSLFDLPESETQREIDTIVSPGDAWEELLPGCSFRDFDGGPGLGEAHAGLVRLRPGGVFPAHRHVGEERMLVLQGRVRDEHGNEYRAGDLFVMADGTSHELTVVGDQDAIYAAVVIAMDFLGDDDDDGA